MENETTISKKLDVKKLQIFSGATLKLIACALMFIDHFGFIFLPTDTTIYNVSRGIGRLAFPLFAFFIAEGCKYTKNKFRHFAMIFSAGVICEVVIVLFTKQFIGNIFLTFSISIALIYLLEFIKKNIFDKKIFDAVLAFIAFISAVVALNFAFGITMQSKLLMFPQKFTLDYGIYGILAPVAISLFDFSRIENAPEILKKIDCLPVKLLAFSLALLPLALSQTPDFIGVQFLQYLALPLLLLYNGKKGVNIKYFFYLFYPLHMAILYGIDMFL